MRFNQVLSRAKWPALFAFLIVTGCSSPAALGPSGSSTGGDTQTDDTAVDDTTTPPTPDQDPDVDTGDENVDGDEGNVDGDDGNIDGDDGDDNEQVAGGIRLTGRIRAPETAGQTLPDASPDEGFILVAQSKQTGDIYNTFTDESGDFEFEIPASEQGHSFIVTIIGPDGQPDGPILFDQDPEQETGFAGLRLDSALLDGGTNALSLGTIEVPEDPTRDPILPGGNADPVLGDLVDADLYANLNSNGVPVGVPHRGKGDKTLVGNPDPELLADPDHDGLIDLVDADNDGDGIIDDFDGDGDPGGIPADIIVNFFMNLKIAAEGASPYYGGSPDAINAALATDTIITLEVMTEPVATRRIVAVEALETPGPPYMPIADEMADGATTSGLAFTNWASLGYVFGNVGDRFSVFVRPNTVMNAGDTFTIAVTYDDGATEYYSRMINYVFKNIPRLVRYGADGGLTDFDITDPAVSGTPGAPILFDGEQDLALVFNPPPDETGAYLTGLDYTFQMFYEQDDGTQLNGVIDVEATWPTPPAGLENTTYWVYADDLTLASDNTYTVTLPRDIFPDTVRTTSGPDPAVVSRYKIDITAECPTGNAAIMLTFRKQ